MTPDEELELLGRLSQHAIDIATAEQHLAQLRSGRNALIVQAVRAGISDHAVCIAAELGKPQVYAILRDPDVPTPINRTSVIGVHVINAVFPCCGHAARFRDHNVRRVEKQCHVCGAWWITTRETAIRSARGRIDILAWQRARIIEEAA